MKQVKINAAFVGNIETQSDLFGQLMVIGEFGHMTAGLPFAQDVITQFRDCTISYEKDILGVLFQSVYPDKEAADLVDPFVADMPEDAVKLWAKSLAFSLLTGTLLITEDMAKFLKFPLDASASAA